MNKNFIVIALIFVVPIAIYWGLTKNNMTLPSVAAEGDCVIKFSSPMCYECQELEKVFDEVYPNYNRDIKLIKIDVTQNDGNTRELVKEYEVTLVPTTVFKNQDGRVLRKIEGSIQNKVLHNYMKELINE